MSRERKVLNDGFVRLVDRMGDDHAVVQAARVSYGAGTKSYSEDEALIRYLMRNYHTTPFEMVELKFHIRAPMDCWRQWIRHRTACLAGDNLLDFDLPSGVKRRGNQKYTLSVKDIFERFQPSYNQRPDKQRYQYHKRDRVQNMLLRCFNEDTSVITHTHIVDIWESGVKDIYTLSTTDSEIKASEDHLILTSEGWKKLKDIVVNVDKVICLGKSLQQGPKAQSPNIDYKNERWLPVVGWEDYYKVSDQGRIQRITGGRGSQYGRYKKITISKDRAVVTLNRPGVQDTKLVSILVLEAFKGCKTHPSFEACHNNGNSLDNRVENLRWDTPKNNVEDKIQHGDTTKFGIRLELVTAKIKTSTEMTYDIEVEGPYHNFSCNSIVTHNSVNEYSTRYSEAIDSCQTTEEWRMQGTGNKQGSSGLVVAWADGYEVTCRNGTYHVMCPNGTVVGSWDHEPSAAEYLTYIESTSQEALRDTYEERLKFGVAREQARKDLPLSTYTEAYWKIDLHNLFHFLRLRLDSHAQYEIRQYAKAIFCIIDDNEGLNASCRAFEDYRLNAITLSGPEIAVLRGELDREVLSKREQAEYDTKLIIMGLKDDKRNDVQQDS